MKKSKSKKIIIIVASVVVLLIVSVYPMARYGWKMSGVLLCESPSSVIVSSVSVGDDSVTLKGNTTSSATAFVGYIYETKDNTLYVGLKYNLLFGFSDRDGSFDISIPVGDGIDKVVIKGGTAEEIVYEK
ncbi:MAG: hypothetical protein FWF82_00405 [Oscillospiraceae bacterium]|nr:hypothetical protein [Oscillospiraceae bacterium]